MKSTKQRNVILDIINNSYDHLDAYGVYEEARKKIPNISLGTVYRNLKALEDAKIIPVVEPSLNIEEINENKVVFKFTMISKPEVTLGEYKKLGLKKEKAKVSKEEILQKSFDILDNDELNYLNISEDILYNSAFCEIISKRDNTRTIPISLVKEEIEKYKSRTRKKN